VFAGPEGRLSLGAVKHRWSRKAAAAGWANRLRLLVLLFKVCQSGAEIQLRRPAKSGRLGAGFYNRCGVRKGRTLGLDSGEWGRISETPPERKGLSQKCGDEMQLPG
jgi:hypothetical protein